MLIDPAAVHGPSAPGRNAALGQPHLYPLPATTHAGNHSEQADTAIDWAWVDDLPPPSPEDYEQPGPPVLCAPLDGYTASHPTRNHDETVEISRHQLDSLKTAAQQFLTYHHKLSTARAELSSLRSQSTYERLEFMRSIDRLRESQTLLASALTDYPQPQERTSYFSSSVERHRQQMHSDYQSSQSCETRARNTEAQLSTTEFYISKEELQATTVAARLAEELTNSGLLPQKRHEDAEQHSSTDTHESVPLRAPSPRLPPALEHYYEKVGELKYKAERIDDLFDEYRELHLDRMWKQDRSEALVSSDELFEAEFVQKLHNVRAAHELARVEVDQARKECVSQRIDPQFLHHGTHSPTLTLSAVDNDDEPVSRHEILTPPWTNLLSPRNASSSILTSATGPLFLNRPWSSRHKKDIPRSSVSITDWMWQVPSDFEFLEEHLDKWPLLGHRRSVHDLRELPTITDPKIQEYLLQNFQIPIEPERSCSEPFLYRQRQAWMPRPRRSPSEPGLDEMRRLRQKVSTHAARPPEPGTTLSMK